MKVRPVYGVVAFGAVLAVASACASVLGIEPLDFPPVESEAGPSAPIDTAACMARVADDASGAFVRTTGADAPDCGTRALPCKTVGAGVARARALGKGRVFVSDGQYVESVALAPGISIEGAWTEDWTPSCKDGANGSVVVQGPSPDAPVVTADDLGGTATLALLTVRAPDATRAGQSVLAIAARGATTKIVLEDALVQSGKAGDGTPGAPGDAGVSATDACDAGTGQSNTNPGVTGSVSVGTFTRNGYTPGGGGNGGPGGAGAPGAATPPTCVSCILCSGLCGATTNCGPVNDSPSCGTAGQSGCGGGGGAGGQGGTGGGSSIALYLWDAHAEIRGGGLAGGRAGRGGNGGAPGAAGRGAPGVAGSPGRTCNVTDFCSCDMGTCASHAGANNKGAGDAGVGFPGGNGAAGGTGGGGAGGSSFAVFHGGGATFDQLRQPVLTHADPVSGGDPNGPPGGANAIGP